MNGSLIFVIILIVSIILQALTNILHVKYYKKTVKETAQRFRTGYLGVGITKKMFRPGKVAILVTDSNGVIRECSVLAGLVVLSRFHEYKEYVGNNINDINWKKKKHKLVVQDAIKQIDIQMNKISKTDNCPK